MHYLSEYQTFASKYELDNAVYNHIKRNSYDLNETERTTLKTIAHYAVKFAGASHLKAATLAGLIGKSEKTARRALAKLQALGIVRKVATTRKVNGGKGANIIQILPVEAKPAGAFLPQDDQSSLSSRQVAEKPTESNVEVTKIGTEPSNSIKPLKNNTLLDTSIPSDALKNALPSEIYDAMSRYFNAEDIYKYYGILLRAKRSVSYEVMIEDNPEPFVTTFHSAVLKAKQGKLRNLANYLYSAWQSATATVIRIQNRESGSWYDWLTEDDDEEACG